jgi:hypothetical protein
VRVETRIWSNDRTSRPASRIRKNGNQPIFSDVWALNTVSRNVLEIASTNDPDGEAARVDPAREETGVRAKAL